MMNAARVLKVLISIALSLALAQLSLAADFTVSSASDCTLADAIQAANSDSAVGNCAAGSGSDTIYLSGDITLGGNLPTIRSTMTISSNDHSIKRVISGNHAHRIFNIEDGGNLTLVCLQLINGRNHGQRGGAVRVLNGHASITDVRMETTGRKKAAARCASAMAAPPTAICANSSITARHWAAPSGSATKAAAWY